MTAFVVFAAGPGTRVGRVGGDLHKSLLPLGQKAVLSHLFDRAPRGSHLVVCVGNRAQQIRDYVELAHPDLGVTFVDVPDWDKPGAGPGRTLLAARDVVGDDDMIVTSCDTLWTDDPSMWETSGSWAAYAAMPAGTELDRWCRLDVQKDTVIAVIDKRQDCPSVRYVYVGMARIAAHDLPRFWKGITTGATVEGEVRDVGGLDALVRTGLGARRIDWIDTGDADAYRRAVAQFSGYDWTKTDQATYVLPNEGRVVKYMRDPKAIAARLKRGNMLKNATPRRVALRGNMLAYDYVNGETVYSRLDRPNRSLDSNIVLVRRLMEWRAEHLTEAVPVSRQRILDAVQRFYVEKTTHRVAQLSHRLSRQAFDAVKRVDFYALVDGFKPGVPHGDFNFGNALITPAHDFVGIDWREDFAGEWWFDLRYDVAKLLAGTMVHWDRARRGDFTPWDQGPRYEDAILDAIGDDARDVATIAALSLINCAPLHAEPLDEILVARGCAWLEQLT